MANARRSSGSGSGSSSSVSPPAVGGEYVGVEDSDIENNPDEFFGELFRGAFFKKFNRDRSVPAGGDITVSGVVRFDAPSVIVTTRGMRVRITSPQLSEDITQRFRNISHANQRKFRLNIPVPDNPGSRFAYTVKAESTKAFGGWRTDSTEGPFNVEIQTETAANVTEGITYLPAAGVGAGAGLLADQFANIPLSRYQSAAAGAGAGVFLKEYGPPVTFGSFVPDVSNVQLALVGGAALSVAYLLNSTGASEVLQPIGETVGSAASVGAGVAQRGAEAARSRLSSPR